jgi:hypothetical protein
MEKIRNKKVLPSWMYSGGHERTGIKILLVSPKEYVEMLKVLNEEEKEKFQAIAEALANATPDQQEAFKIGLAEILGFVSLIKYSSEESIRREVKTQITGNPSYLKLLELEGKLRKAA